MGKVDLMLFKFKLNWFDIRFILLLITFTSSLILIIFFPDVESSQLRSVMYLSPILFLMTMYYLSFLCFKPAFIHIGNDIVVIENDSFTFEDFESFNVSFERVGRASNSNLQVSFEIKFKSGGALFTKNVYKYSFDELDFEKFISKIKNNVFRVYVDDGL